MVMVIALVMAAVTLAAVAAFVAVRASRRARRYGEALERLEQQLRPISRSIRASVERSRATSPELARDGLDPTLEELLERIAADGSAVAALRQLAEEVAPGVSSRRRSPARGNGQAYEAELEREVARARRTGRPLSLVLLDVDQPTPDRLLQLAALLTRATRVTDTVCRRRRDAFGILLPETAEDGAQLFFARLGDEVAQTFGPAGRTTFSTGIVEWRPNENGEALDARARAAIDGRAVSVDLAADTPA